MDRFSADPAVIERREWYAKMQKGFYKQREQVDSLREESLASQDLHFGSSIIDQPIKPISINLVRKKSATIAKIANSKWVSQLYSSQTPLTSHAMRTTIVCFPGAGCNISSFSNLALRVVAEHIAVVYSVCLPGRMNRLKETWSGSSIRKVVKIIQQEMLQMGLIRKETSDIHRAIFIGHDVGAIIAYELLRAFTRDGVVIAGLIVMSMRSPLVQTHSNFERKVEVIETDEKDEEASHISGSSHSRQDTARSNLSAADEKASQHSKDSKTTKYSHKSSIHNEDDKAEEQAVEEEAASASAVSSPKELLPSFKTLTNKQLLNSIAHMGGIPPLLHERKDIMRKLVVNFRTDAELLDDYCISAPSFPGLPYYEPEVMTQDDIHEILEMPPQLFKLHIPIFTIYGQDDIWFDESEVLAWGLATDEHDHFLVEDCDHYQLLQSSQVHEIVVNMIARMQAAPEAKDADHNEKHEKECKSEASFN